MSLSNLQKKSNNLSPRYFSSHPQDHFIELLETRMLYFSTEFVHSESRQIHYQKLKNERTVFSLNRI